LIALRRREHATQGGGRESGDDAIRPGRFWWIAVLRGAFGLLLGAAALVSQGDRRMLANSSAFTGFLVDS
jgi:hypothetical protein